MADILEFPLLCLENPLLGVTIPNISIDRKLIAITQTSKDKGQYLGAPTPSTHLAISVLTHLSVSDDAMLEKYGLKLDDTILAEPKHMPIYDELIQNRNAKIIAGGAAQNTARGASYMLPPNSVWYIGCVGNDESADTLRQICMEQGVHVEYRVDEKEPTGK